VEHLCSTIKRNQIKEIRQPFANQNAQLLNSKVDEEFKGARLPLSILLLMSVFKSFPVLGNEK